MVLPAAAERVEVEEWRLHRHAAAVRMRWVASALVLVALPVGYPPILSIPAGAAIVAAMLGYNLVAWRLGAVAGRLGNWLRAACVAGDFLACTGLVLLYANHTDVASYFSFAIVGTEAAILYTWRGLVIFAAGLVPAVALVFGVQVGVLGEPVSLQDAVFVPAIVLTVSALVAGVTRNGDHQHSEVVRLSVTDALTGLANLRAFRDRLELETRQARRQGRQLSMLAVDLDHFKAINDTRGHAAGDAALQALARLLASGVLRAGVDLAGRVGGEEFSVILPDARLPDAARVGERLRSAVEAPASGVLTTISVGAAELQAGATAEDLMRAADRALYRAKERGRNQVVADGRIQQRRHRVGA